MSELVISMKDKNGVEIQQGDICTASLRVGVVGLRRSGTVSIRVPYQTYALEPEDLEVDLSARISTETQGPARAVPGVRA
jgi:hypothetical protein